MIDRITEPNSAEIRTWLPIAEIEPGALQQLQNAARHPEAGEAIAVMPDCHVGYGVNASCRLRSGARRSTESQDKGHPDTRRGHAVH